MARMKTTTAPKRVSKTLTIKVDPLGVPRGHRKMPTGGIHRSTPRRAAARRAAIKESRNG